MAEQDCCTFLRGSMYVSKYIDPCSGFDDLSCNSEDIFYKLGNLSQASLTVNSSLLGTESILNHTSYPLKARHIINSVNLNLNVSCSKDKNLIRFLGMEQGELNAGNEVLRFICPISQCSVLFLKKNPTVNSITLKDALGVTVRVLTEGVDYSVSLDSVEFLIDIVDDYSYLEVDYDFDETDYQTLKAHQDFNLGYRVLFKGVNYAEGIKESFDVDIYKVRFQFLSSLDLISDGNFLNLSLQGRVEKDLSRDCKGHDAYYSIKKVTGGC